jgi:ribosome biogenesis GTPase A
MAKANRDIAKMQKFADLFIVVLDARAPISTYNDDLDNLAPNTPRLIIIAKADLCDLNKKEKITQKLEKYGHSKII